MDKGKLYLIPTILGEGTQESTLPSTILKAIKEIDVFIVENLRTARRHIRKLDREKNIDATTFYSYGKYDTLNLEQDFLPHILSGQNVGLLSEAGLPCVADPGSKIVAYAHDFQIDVVPFVGPSSILLALMASGLNGQNFAFTGYLPIDKSERTKIIKQLEELVKKTGQTQIFMETPYRNNQLIETLLKTCSNNTKLCTASDITLPTENIKTKTIAEWKQTKINLDKKPTIFLIG
ncbi:MAG: SAM-dependent methyltransferase [Bacteroidetes bacterium]|nr:SAM-dependent methyltransferase [Bacteroidota bacterium]MDA1009113.1 SAM-dependent methyltransferase [Bacteroidota bacterium]